MDNKKLDVKNLTGKNETINEISILDKLLTEYIKSKAICEKVIDKLEKKDVDKERMEFILSEIKKE